MSTDNKYSCVTKFGAELSMYIGVCVTMYSLSLASLRFLDTNLLLSTAYAILLPLMSYLFSVVKQSNAEGRAQLILFWMVLVEVIHISGAPIFSWGPVKSAEQLVRLLWVGFLVYTNTSIQGIRANLLVLCIYFSVYEIIKGIAFYKGKRSCLIGKNPKLIHNYVKKIMLGYDLQTTPVNNCDYIVMGEQNHEIDDCSNGYSLGKPKSNSQGKLTIGRVLQLNLPNADTCISLALAKMLRRRFAKFPLDEAGCTKVLDFVLKGLIGDIGGHQDTQTDRNDEKRNNMKRVFCIIEEELTLVDDFLILRIPTYYYFRWYGIIVLFGFLLVLADGIYLTHTIRKMSSARLSLRGLEASNPCHFIIHASGSDLAVLTYVIDQVITIGLVVITICIVLLPEWEAMKYNNHNWSKLKSVERYIENPANWNRSYSSEAPSEKELPIAQGENAEKVREYFMFQRFLPMWIKRKFPTLFLRVLVSADAKEAILTFLRESGGQLTNGETSLQKYAMGDLNWACKPNGSNTEAILVWHIATTLHHCQEPSPQQNNDPNQEPSPQQNNDPNQEPEPQQINDPNQEPVPQQNNDPNQEPTPQQNNNPFTKEVALCLSSYCYYLVANFPELLPDDVKWTKKMYRNVKNDISDISLSSDHCKYALDATWHGSSVVKDGVKLAKELMNCNKEGKHVWMMLVHFWAEMMLFIAPSDNLEGHEKILPQKELITQLWALLTHAGIITRPKPTGADNV